MQYIEHLDFIFDIFSNFFTMPGTLAIIAGMVFLSMPLLEKLIFRG